MILWSAIICGIDIHHTYGIWFLFAVQQEIMLQKIMSHIAAVKKDMIILEKSEFSALLAENDVSAMFIWFILFIAGIIHDE